MRAIQSILITGIMCGAAACGGRGSVVATQDAVGVTQDAGGAEGLAGEVAVGVDSTDGAGGNLNPDALAIDLPDDSAWPTCPLAAPPTVPADIQKGVCQTIEPVGQWVAAAPLDVSTFPAPSGGTLLDGEYDLVSLLAWKPPPGYLDRRFLQLSQAGTLIRMSSDTKGPSGVTVSVRFEAAAVATSPRLRINSACGDDLSNAYGYSASADTLVLYYPDPALRDAPHTETTVYTYRRRCR